MTPAATRSSNGGGAKTFTRFCCAVIDLCITVRCELILEGDFGFFLGQIHVDLDVDACGEAVCAFLRFKNQVIDAILDVFQCKGIVFRGVFALALVIPAAGDRGFVRRQTVLVGRENGTERNGDIHAYAVHRIASILGRRERRLIPIDLHRERRAGDDHVGNCFSGIAVDPFLPTIREIEIAAGVQKLVSRAARACDRPIASCAGTQLDTSGAAGQRIDRAGV